jgi:hypothetical protein
VIASFVDRAVPFQTTEGLIRRFATGAAAMSQSPAEEPIHPAERPVLPFGIVLGGIPGFVLASADGSAAAIRVLGGVLLAFAFVCLLLVGVARILRDHQLWLEARARRGFGTEPMP